MCKGGLELDHKCHVKRGHLFTVVNCHKYSVIAQDLFCLKCRVIFKPTGMLSLR
uniref:Uncharacterized protein n=1 Tax=Anguilla anguilla TaxID=7936 RepID=A0A0E9VLS9_ANGAN